MKKLILALLLLINITQLNSITISTNTRNNIIAGAAAVVSFIAINNETARITYKDFIRSVFNFEYDEFWENGISIENQFLIAISFYTIAIASMVGVFKLTKHLLTK